jgi:hypothetical protein
MSSFFFLLSNSLKLCRKKKSEKILLIKLNGEKAPWFSFSLVVHTARTTYFKGFMNSLHLSRPSGPNPRKRAILRGIPSKN